MAVSKSHLAFKIFSLVLAVIIIGVASAGTHYAQFEYSRDLFIAILVLSCFVFLLLLAFCLRCQHTEDYDISKTEKGKENNAFEGEDSKADPSKLDSVKWVSNYTSYSEQNGDNKKAESSKEEEEEKKDEAEKKEESWKKNYVPYEGDEEESNGEVKKSQEGNVKEEKKEEEEEDSNKKSEEEKN